MNSKLVFGLLSLCLLGASCSSNSLPDSSSGSSDTLLNYYYSTCKLEGSIHKISGEGDYFKYQDSLYKVYIVKKDGWVFLGTTDIYVNGEKLDHKTIDDSTFKEGEKCYGVITYGFGYEKDPREASSISFKNIYLSSLYFENA